MEELKKFIEDNMLNGFSTDDFEHDITESFKGVCVPKIKYDNSSGIYPVVIIWFNNECYWLHYKRSVFTDSNSYYYTLIKIE